MELPQVAGEFNDSPNNFEYRCKVMLAVEQEKILPDNRLIALLCDAVRLKRKFYGEYSQSELNYE